MIFQLFIGNVLIINILYLLKIEDIGQRRIIYFKVKFLDRDPIPNLKDDKIPFSGERIKRGLYKSGSGCLINADVNGSYNIMRKNEIIKVIYKREFRKIEDLRFSIFCLYLYYKL